MLLPLGSLMSIIVAKAHTRKCMKNEVGLDPVLRGRLRAFTRGRKCSHQHREIVQRWHRPDGITVTFNHWTGECARGPKSASFHVAAFAPTDAARPVLPRYLRGRRVCQLI